MKNSKIIIVVILIALILGSLFIYKSSRHSAALENIQQNVNNTSDTAPSLSEDAIPIKGFNYGFSPKEITVKQGETVKIKLTSDDSPHTFTIDELGVNQFFTYGKDATVTFTASQKGTFQFYCAVPGHKESGMVGTLVVN